MGKRTIKTTLAVFVTAGICTWLNWPVIFAVIAAMVTIEPTVAMSVRKARTRIPAAAIGAAFAMSLEFWLGQAPLTYALSALATIIVCSRFHWNDAILVATLTAVNMIAVTQDHFLASFVTRLGTTVVGIGVSTVINYAILPPDFTGAARQKLAEAASGIDAWLRWAAVLPQCRRRDAEHLMSGAEPMLRSLLEGIKLTEYQREECLFHRKRRGKLKTALRLQRMLRFYSLTLHRLSAVLSLRLDWESPYHRAVLDDAMKALAAFVEGGGASASHRQEKRRRVVMELARLEALPLRQEALD
ncbi:aromatic acid exporter family protein [Paenibacillus turpanensis]|uniref:aromatic acid exporter family protein n=1 Tax=Paenibacillus turpanensis TaxID=2689078 RepID=UPI0014073703|nr:aromatic acid exporter family protein [Paenibacillus turpanensis]